MKLIEALEILKKAPPEPAPPLNVRLVCGFTPLHLQTFLHAHLRLQFPDRKIELQTGLYGDFAGNAERVDDAGIDAAAAALEWPDLDPRLGIRQLGGWGPKELPDILNGVEARLERLRAAITRGEAAGAPVLVFSLPTLPLPPLAITAGWQASQFDLELREKLAGFAAWAAKRQNVRMVSVERLDQLSPAPERLDVRSDLLTGFPYKLGHAGALAQLLASLIRNPIPKKGLITDLDDTLWSGLLGEVGIDGIAWDLDHGAQIHGIYQQFLRALAEEGVLIGAASKNDPAVVEEAFHKAAPLLPLERIFPLEVHWSRKSESVTRILQAWNVGADSVVFVDDSAMEIADVKRTH
ncbi:MAG: HAD-IIIC family phosphatase, partial [Terriglobia bacterium]